MSHKWFKNKNHVKEARDKVAKGKRARVRGLLASNLSTPSNRLSLDETKVQQLVGSSHQLVE